MKKSLFFILALFILFLLQYFAVLTNESMSYYGKPDFIFAFILTIIPLIIFTVELILNRGVNYFRCIVYPLFTFAIYFGIFAFLTTKGSVILWFLAFTIVPFSIIPLIIFLISLCFDIKSYIKNKELKAKNEADSNGL